MVGGGSESCFDIVDISVSGENHFILFYEGKLRSVFLHVASSHTCNCCGWEGATTTGKPWG